MTEAKGAGERPEPVIADPTRLARLGSATLTPEGVIADDTIRAEVAALPRVVSARQLPAAMAQNHAGYAGAEIAGSADNGDGNCSFGHADIMPDLMLSQ
jgi:hypothetical protein